jgi:hypothetical protein
MQPSKMKIILFNHAGKAGDMHDRKVPPHGMCNARPTRRRMLSCVRITCSPTEVLIDWDYF